MDSDKIRSKAFAGVIWSFINQFGTQILSIVPAMVLARLLTPTEYGLVAMAGIFNGLAFKLSTGGFNDALMQKKNADHLDCCSVFYFNLFINSFFYIIFFFLAPFCADFFDEPQVTPIMRVSLLSLPLVALGGIHAIILRRDLNFKAPALRNMIVQALSAIIAVVMAFCGCGVWSLVVQGVLQTLGNSLINYCLCPWRPTFDFSFNRLKEMFPFGFKVYLSSLINYGFGKATDTTVAKVYSPADLSYYNRAYSTANLFISSFVGVINNVAFPAFARIQGDRKRLKYALGRFVSISSLVSSLLMALLFVLADPLFCFMYSSKWNAVIPYFQIVCVWGLFQPVKNTLEGFLRATGCAGIIMYNRLVNVVLVLLNVYLAWKYGISFMLWGQVFIEISQVCIYAYFTKRFYDYGVRSIISDNYFSVLPVLCVAFITYISDFGVIRILTVLQFSSEFIMSLFRLLISGSFAICSFIVLCRLLDLSAYREIVEMASVALKNKSPKICRLLAKLVKP